MWDKIKEIISLIFGSRLVVEGTGRTFVKVPMWLAVLADMGVSLYFIAGNRDFLIGPRFAAAARMMLLEDATKVGAGGTASVAGFGSVPGGKDSCV